MAAIWRDGANGPRKRSRAESLSQGLYGAVTSPEFAGPGRFYPPRDPLPVRHLDAKTYPFSNDLDRELAGVEPPVRRTSPSDRRGDAPAWDFNPPTRGRGIHRDGQGGAERQPVRVAVDLHDDLMSQLGPEHWLPGERPDAAPGRICAHEPCGKILTPGPAGSYKKFCSADCRHKAWLQKKQAAGDGKSNGPWWW